MQSACTIPPSRKRKDYLRRACDLLPGSAVRDGLRHSPQHRKARGKRPGCTLAQLRELETDMFTTVFVGNSQTRELRGAIW